MKALWGMSLLAGTAIACGMAEPPKPEREAQPPAQRGRDEGPPPPRRDGRRAQGPPQFGDEGGGRPGGPPQRDGGSGFGPGGGRDGGGPGGFGPGGGRDGGGPGGFGPGGNGPGGFGPPRFEPGRVIPPHLRQELRLSKDQVKQLDELEAEVKDRLNKILTPEQMKQLREHRPGQPPGGRRGPGQDQDQEDRRPPDRGGRPRPPQRDGDDRVPPAKDRQPPEKDRRPPEKDGGPGERRPPPPDEAKAPVGGGIQWFATLESGIREAKRTGQPVLLVSAAPHCAGIPGIW